MGSDAFNALVGQRVREARMHADLSLTALATAAGIGKGSLSELENGSRNPTLATLYALAGVLAVPLGYLLAELPGSNVSSPGIRAQLLDVWRDETHTAETYRITLTPGHQHVSPPHGAGVIEYLVVLHGTACAGRSGEEVTLGPGQTTTWLSDVAHTYEARGVTPAEAVLVIRTPHQGAA